MFKMKMKLLLALVLVGTVPAQEVNLNDLLAPGHPPSSTENTASMEAAGDVQSSNQRLTEKWRQSEARIAQIIQEGTSFRSGGSSVGGGNLYSDLAGWCDESTAILDETRIEAQDVLGIYGDQLSAIRIYYSGLVTAIEVAKKMDVSTYSSITYRTIVRGLYLSQYFGVLDILSGRRPVEQRSVGDALDFLDNYYRYLLRTTYNLDRNYFARYYTRKNCSDCNPFTNVEIDEFEKLMVSYSIGQVSFWLNNFSDYRTDGEGSYANLGTRETLAGLAFLLQETGHDLAESLLGNVFSCQISQLNRLSKRIYRYLDMPSDTSLDAAKLTIFKEQAKAILVKIQKNTCEL